MKAFLATCKSEILLVVRGIDTIFFGILFPIVTALFIGVLMGNRTVEEGTYTFIEQSFGAIVSISISATGLMGLPITIADYRQRKILKSYKITPISPTLLLTVQCFINFLITLFGLVGVWGVCKLFFNLNLQGRFLPFLGSYLLVFVATYSIGIFIASISPNIKIAGILCSAVYFPMILLSGATIPYEIMPGRLQNVINYIPMTQGIKLLKCTSLGLTNESLFMPILVLTVISVLFTFVSIVFFKWE